ncbi:MAG: sigma factor-like helix-turn-helix DNA-binding protein [Halanaerobiales bacterium]
MKDKFKIEELLKNYRSLKSEIRIEIIQKCPEYSLPAIDYSKTGSGETNNIYSEVEDYVIRKQDIEIALKKKIKIRDIIKAALDSLNIEKKRIVTYLYFEGISQTETSFRVKISERTISTRKKEIMRELKKAGILTAWEYWEEVQ